MVMAGDPAIGRPRARHVGRTGTVRAAASVAARVESAVVRWSPAVPSSGFRCSLDGGRGGVTVRTDSGQGWRSVTSTGFDTSTHDRAGADVPSWETYQWHR